MSPRLFLGTELKCDLGEGEWPGGPEGPILSYREEELGRGQTLPAGPRAQASGVPPPPATQGERRPRLPRPAVVCVDQEAANGGFVVQESALHRELLEGRASEGPMGCHCMGTPPR